MDTHARCLLLPHMGWNAYNLHGYMHVSCILHWLACVHMYNMVFKAIFIINTIHWYVHLAFKELRTVKVYAGPELTCSGWPKAKATFSALIKQILSSIFFDMPKSKWLRLLETWNTFISERLIQKIQYQLLKYVQKHCF